MSSILTIHVVNENDTHASSLICQVMQERVAGLIRLTIHEQSDPFPLRDLFELKTSTHSRRIRSITSASEILSHFALQRYFLFL